MQGLEGTSSDVHCNGITLDATLKIGVNERFLSRQIPEVVQ